MKKSLALVLCLVALHAEASDVLIAVSGARDFNGGRWPYTAVKNLDTGETVVDDLFFVFDMVATDGVLYVPGGSSSVSSFDVTNGDLLSPLTTELRGLASDFDVDTHGNIYVGDARPKHHAIRVFDSEGEQIRSTTDSGFPTRFAVNSVGDIISIDDQSLTIVSGETSHRTAVPIPTFDAIELGENLVRNVNVVDVETDAEDNIYLLLQDDVTNAEDNTNVSYSRGVIEKFAPNGSYEGTFYSINMESRRVAATRLRHGNDSLYMSYRPSTPIGQIADGMIDSISLDGVLLDQWTIPEAGVTAITFVDGTTPRVQAPTVVDGDLDGDGLATVEDLDLLSLKVRERTDDERFDLNRDGKVSLNDRLFWVQEIKKTRMGDANLDGRFDTSDIVRIFKSGEFNDDIPGNSTWEDGDFNGDGDFKNSDLLVALWAGWPRAGAAAVPEPAGGSLFVFAIATMMLLKHPSLRR